MNTDRPIRLTDALRMSGPSLAFLAVQLVGIAWWASSVSAVQTEHSRRLAASETRHEGTTVALVGIAADVGWVRGRLERP